MTAAGRVPVLVITGPCGVGKSTVAEAIGDQLEQAGVAHAVVDLDSLRRSAPRPADDRFNERVGLRNLAAVWSVYRGAGAERLVLVDIVVDRRKLDGYRAAIPGAEIALARLCAPVGTMQARLERRESGDSLRWHQRRAEELAGLMDAAAAEDLLVETDGRAVSEIAAEILARADRFRR